MYTNQLFYYEHHWWGLYALGLRKAVNGYKYQIKLCLRDTSAGASFLEPEHVN